MAQDFLAIDDELSDVLASERADVRRVGKETTETTTQVLEESQNLLGVYSEEQTVINKEADAALTKLRTSIDQYNTLQNAGTFEQIGNAFMGIFDPSKDINRVAQRVGQNQTQLKLAETGRKQSQDKLNTGMREGQAELQIAGAKLGQEERELELVKGEIAEKRASARARLEQQQIFLTTQDETKLDAAVKSGYLTKQQELEEKDRRKRQKLAMEQLDMSVEMQRGNVAEHNRTEIIRLMPKHQVQAALNEAQLPENGGQYKVGNFIAFAPELKARLEEFKQVEVATASENLVTAEAGAVSKSAADLISRYTGTDVSDMDITDAYAVLAKSPIWNPTEASGMRQVQALSGLTAETEDGPTRAAYSQELLKKSGEIIEMMNAKVRNKFPSKNTAVAVDQQLETGVIYDNSGAQQLTMTSALSGAATGSNMYDDLLIQMRPVSASAAATPALAEIGAFQEDWVNASNSASNFAYTTGIYETMALVANDPEFAGLKLAAPLANTSSSLYGGVGKFNINNLANYFKDQFGDGASPQWAVFQRAMAKHLDKYAQATFGYTGATPEGAMAISSLNNQLFGNAPVRNFVSQSRTKLYKTGQAFNLVRD